MREGLLQDHRLWKRVQTSPILEIGIVAGLCLITMGSYLGFELISYWGSKNFGALTQGELLRTVSLSTLFITFGGICMLGSMIIGFLTLPTRRN
jgi:multisubunit Na+/H+ antiporter MnhB subunit